MGKNKYNFRNASLFPSQTSKKNVFLLLGFLLITACDNSDPTSQDFDDLKPSWDIQFDSSTRRLDSSGAVFSNRIESDLLEGDVRLTHPKSSTKELEPKLDDLRARPVLSAKTCRADK